MLTILQLSDIHFAHSEGDAFDLDREIEDGLLRFLPELRQTIDASVDLIVVSGDVAFSGVAEQYERAKAFLRNVRSKLGNPNIPVLVIPGNHDIHRKITREPDQREWRAKPRSRFLEPHQRQTTINALLKGEQSGPGLFQALEAYNDFAASFECAVNADQPHWERSFPLGQGWMLRVRGMTSVLISDEHDDDDKLVLGEAQALGLDAKPGEVVLSLCHHPYCWLLDGEQLRPKLTNRSHMHITGHVHQHGFDASPEHVHLRAGALQPPRSEKVGSRFNLITLAVRSEQAEAEVTLLPVVWKPEDDAFVVDRANCETCSVAVTAPAPDAVDAADEEHVAAVTRLTERLGSLQYADRLHCARQIRLGDSDLFTMPPRNQINAIVARATAAGRLAALWEQVELRHGRQSGPDANPFRESAT